MFGHGKNYMEKGTTCTINKKMIMNKKDIDDYYKLVDKLEKIKKKKIEKPTDEYAEELVHGERKENNEKEQ